MAPISLTLTELSAIVLVAVGLAATDAAAVSRLVVAYTAKKAGLKPGEIMRYDHATDGDQEDEADVEQAGDQEASHAAD